MKRRKTEDSEEDFSAEGNADGAEEVDEGR